MGRAADAFGEDIFGTSKGRAPDPKLELMARRDRLMGPNVPTFYETPVHLVRGSGVWLWDAAGRRYLDAYNNVPHVGHCHPAVTAAIARQAGQLNTHTRYLHEGLLDYIERLTSTLGHGLSQMILTCTGSEANDVALRMALAATGKRGVIATDTTYHGNTTATAQLSTRRPPVGGYPDHVRLIPAPEGRAPGGGAAFAEGMRRAIAELEAAGHGAGAFIFCPVFANEGLPGIAPAFLDPAAALIRAAGGLLIADEVQPGFGRIGSDFWGHDWLGVAPDVVTMGKPMGNGHPIAGVAARPEVMAAFRGAFGYFNTFGGNPVSCAAGMAVLDVIEAEGLQNNAAAIGARLLAGLHALRHPFIGRAHGLGLLLALDFTGPDGTAASGGPVANSVVEGLLARGILTGRIGRHMNVLKMRPPLCFGAEHADLLLASLAEVLAEMPGG